MRRAARLETQSTRGVEQTATRNAHWLIRFPKKDCRRCGEAGQAPLCTPCAYRMTKLAFASFTRN